MKNFALGFVSCLCLIIAVGLFGNLMAENWMVITVHSKHINADKSYEEDNWGIGMEHSLRGDFRAVGGMYRNSNRRESLYTGISWAPLKFGDFRLGAAALLISGYETTTKQDLVKALIPALSWEGSRFGVNVPFLPPNSYGPALVALQLKMRFP